MRGIDNTNIFLTRNRSQMMIDNRERERERWLQDLPADRYKFRRCLRYIRTYICMRKRAFSVELPIIPRQVDSYVWIIFFRINIIDVIQRGCLMEPRLRFFEPESHPFDFFSARGKSPPILGSTRTTSQFHQHQRFSCFT